MTEQMHEFQQKFRVRELELASNDYWIWSLRPAQCTLGAGVLSLATFSDRFSKMSVEAAGALCPIVQVIERTLSLFQYDKINYLMLMMIDPHVHFHVVPRYSRDVCCFGQTWTDTGWPTTPDLAANQAGEEALQLVAQALRSELE